MDITTHSSQNTITTSDKRQKGPDAMKNRSRLLLTISLFTLAMTVAGSTTAGNAALRSNLLARAKSAPALIKVQFGHIPGLEGSSLIAIGEDQGYWKDAGLIPIVKDFTNGPLEIQAMQTGNLDYAFIGNGAMWLVASGKAKVISIADMGVGDRLVAQPGIKTVKQLKGKTIGVPLGTSGEIIVQLALKKAGMSMSDVNIVNMDPSTIVPAFLSNRIDAAGIWYPLISTIKAQIPNINELAKDGEFISQLAFPSSFIASNDQVKSHLATVKKVLSVLQKANDYRYANMDKAMAITANFINQPLTEMQVQAQPDIHQFFSTAQLFKANQNGTVTKWFNSLGAYFVKTGKLQTVPDSRTYYLAHLYNQVYLSNHKK